MSRPRPSDIVLITYTTDSQNTDEISETVSAQMHACIGAVLRLTVRQRHTRAPHCDASVRQVRGKQCDFSVVYPLSVSHLFSIALQPWSQIPAPCLELHLLPRFSTSLSRAPHFDHTSSHASTALWINGGPTRTSRRAAHHSAERH